MIGLSAAVVLAGAAVGCGAAVAPAACGEKR